MPQPIRLVLASRLLGLAALTCALPPAAAQTPPRVSIVVGTPVGGGYDAYARLLSRHLGRFLPGNPHVIVANKPGAGGYLAANYAANVAPQRAAGQAAKTQYVDSRGLLNQNMSNQRQGQTPRQ